MWLRIFCSRNQNPFAAVNRSDFLKTIGLGALGSLITTGAAGARNQQLVASDGAAGAPAWGAAGAIGALGVVRATTLKKYVMGLKEAISLAFSLS